MGFPAYRAGKDDLGPDTALGPAERVRVHTLVDAAEVDSAVGHYPLGWPGRRGTRTLTRLCPVAALSVYRVCRCRR